MLCLYKVCTRAKEASHESIQQEAGDGEATHRLQNLRNSAASRHHCLHMAGHVSAGGDVLPSGGKFELYHVSFEPSSSSCVEFFHTANPCIHL